MDDKEFPEVLIDATRVGGKSEWRRQSIQPYIGMTVEFITNTSECGYNFIIIS